MWITQNSKSKKSPKNAGKWSFISLDIQQQQQLYNKKQWITQKKLNPQ